jgi:hypothetical protein
MAGDDDDDSGDDDDDGGNDNDGGCHCIPCNKTVTITVPVQICQTNGSIGDCVWNDLNQNGIKDAGEPGVPNVTVQLRNCQNQILQTTTTNGNGIYTFSNLPAGCYRVCIVTPSGFQISPQNVGNDASDSDISPTDGCTANIDLSPGENDPTNDAGIFQPGGGTPDCVNGISITATNTSIVVTGLNGAPVSSLQVFNASWQTIFNCFANCGASQTVNVPAGTYYVYAKYFTAGYQLICEKQATVTVTGGSPCANQGGDSDNDGVCNNQDCQPNNPAFPATPGTPCNDGNPNTSNDVVTADGCGCAGTPVNPCANQGGDSDGDGVCNNQDCQPNNPAFPAIPGTPCNDGNPNTTNDVVTANGCGCAGTPVAGCNVSVNGCVITITGLTASNSAKIFNSNWNILFDCNPWGNNPCGSSVSYTVPSNGTYWVQACGSTIAYTVSNCGGSPCANQGGDSDGDGVCNNQDCQPNNPAFPATPGTPCNDGNPNTFNDVVTANGCGCAGTPVSTCDNVTNAGTIGWGANCASSISHCPTQGPAPMIGNCVSPTGGTGNLQVIWLKSTTSCNYPTTTITQIEQGLDPHWSIIPGATGLTFSPGNVTQQTCYLRCARRAGCPVYVESNIISLNIAPNCGGGGGTPNCANISISTQPGKIVVGGVNGAPVTQIQVFNTAWQPLHNCFGNCQSPTAMISVSAGTYYVLVKYFSANYQLICEKSQTVNVPTSLGAYHGETFQFEAVKQEEHTELYWVHNGGFHIVEYVLERSLDGIGFEAIYNVPSEGGSRHELYRGYDLEPVAGDNHYRLRMLDTDGTYHYSEIKTVNFPDLPDYVLFPNPANDFVKANLETVVGHENVTITIFNNLGLEVKRFELPEVWSKYYQMDIRDLREGHYIVWLNVPGRRPQARQLMVGKL